MERYLIRYMIGCKQNQFCGGILCKNLISSFARNVFCAEKREVTVKFLVQILRDFASSNPDICLKPAFFRQFHIADGRQLIFCNHSFRAEKAVHQSDVPPFLCKV